MKRRDILKLAPLASVAAVLPFAAKASAPEISDPYERADYHAAQLAKAMNDVRPGSYFVKVDHDLGITMVVDQEWKAKREGPLRADDVTGTNDFADWQEREDRRRRGEGRNA